MNRSHLYIFIMAMSVLFMAFPETQIHPFIGSFSEIPIQLHVYAWIHLVHLQLVLQIALSVYDSRRDEMLSNKAYFWFMVYDWIDFGLTCNSPYTYILGVPITANIISLLGFILVANQGHRVFRRIDRHG